MLFDVNDFLKCEFDKNFNLATKKNIASLLIEAYKLRDECLHAEPILSLTEIGSKDLAAHLLRPAIEKTARIYCLTGKLPFSFLLNLNKAKNSRHILLESPLSTVYFARTQTAWEKPRRVKYRPVVEMDLFSETNALEEDPHVNTFLVNYGDAKERGLSFAGIGIPGARGWLYYESLDLRVVEKQEMLQPEQHEEILVQLIEGIDNNVKKAK